MSLEDLAFIKRHELSLETNYRESFVDLGSEEYRKKVAGRSAGSIIGCFISGGLVLANYLTFGNNIIYALTGVGFVLSLGVGICNFRRDFEITQYWYDR